MKATDTENERMILSLPLDHDHYHHHHPPQEQKQQQSCQHDDEEDLKKPSSSGGGSGSSNMMEEDSQPSLVDSCTDLDASSLDDSSIWYESDTSSLCSSSRKGSNGSSKSSLQRRVSFSKIEVREYNLTLGDHPLCHDGLPLSLDWQHGESTEIHICCSRERTEKYQMPRRLSYEEKRDRLIATADYTDQRARNQELGQVIQRMQSWWQQHPVLPMPNLYDIEEEPISLSTTTNDQEDEPYFEIEPPCLEEYVFEWRRNHHSSRSRRRTSH